MYNDVLKHIAQRAKRRLVGKETKPTAKIKVISNEDEEFKNKVEYLLSQEEVIINPVQYLMDEKLLKNMDDEAKLRYLFSTLDKYNSFKKEIEKNNTDKRFCV